MIIHGLLNWGIYAHSLLQPVPPQLSLYVSFMQFMTILFVFIPPIWEWVVIFISILFVFTSLTYINPCRRRSFPHCKYKTRWWQRTFPYWLVRHCHLRPRHRPPRLDISFFPSPHCTKYWQCRSSIIHVSIRARDFFDLLAKFMGGRKNTPDQYFCGN